MFRRPPISTRTDTLLPYTTLFRSVRGIGQALGADRRQGYSGLRGLAELHFHLPAAIVRIDPDADAHSSGPRSEEHTSELQSLMRNSYAVFCLKKKNKILTNNKTL